MAHPDAVYPVTAALGPLLDIPGVFVFGSNDYYAPKIGNPFTYLVGQQTTTAANRIYRGRN